MCLDSKLSIIYWHDLSFYFKFKQPSLSSFKARMDDAAQPKQNLCFKNYICYRQVGLIKIINFMFPKLGVSYCVLHVYFGCILCTSNKIALLFNSRATTMACTPCGNNKNALYDSYPTTYSTTFSPSCQICDRNLCNCCCQWEGWRAGRISSTLYQSRHQ